ncbi:MAG TPA: TrmH family RNA methyltransferase [Patescibacteria group bacterium]|nr:TrmH family RNA methyltransferase [Patescibacteria group bacterium]
MTTRGHGPHVVTSAANPRVRNALALRDRRGRSESGRLLVDGCREVLRALEAGLVVREAFVADGGRSPDALALVARLAALGVPQVTMAGSAWSRLAYGERGSEIVAVVDAPPTDLAHVEEILARVGEPLLIVVEDAEKPGNLGAIARSADGAGATALLVAVQGRPAADPWHANAVRASLGTVLSLPIAIDASGVLVAWLRSRAIRIVAARVEAAADYREADLRGPLAIVVGSEAAGLGGEWLAPDVLGVHLPMLGRADSLNVSTAAAILLYEARRQRDRGRTAAP